MNRMLSPQIKSTLRYALVGTLACVLATLVAEVFVQAMEPQPLVIDPEDPLVIAMLIDISGSMSGEPIAEMKYASSQFLTTWDRSDTYVALIPFSHVATHLKPTLHPDQNPGILVEQVAKLEADSGTAMTPALQIAEFIFTEIGSTRNAVMLFTDGLPTDEISTRNRAQRLRDDGVVIVAIGTGDANQGFLTAVVGGDADKVFSAQLGDFANTFDQAASTISSSAFGTASTSQDRVLVAIVALFLVAALLVAENVWGLRGRWWRDLWWVLPLGLLLGISGSALGEVIPNRVATWALVGLFCGVALGFTDMAGNISRTGNLWSRIPRKLRRGAVFGLAGGIVGGMIFSLLFRDTMLDTTTGAATALGSRIIGFAILGFFIGLALRLGEELLKDAWLMGVTKGFYEGKHYILNKSLVTVGQSGNNDINLHREKDIADRAGHFMLDSGTWFFQPTQGADAVTVSGMAVSDRIPLQDASSIHFGSTEFVFRQRQDPGKSARETAWVLAGDKSTFALPRQDLIRIGSDPACDIALDDPSVEPHHCTLEFTRQGLCLSPNARAHVSVNDQELAKASQRPLLQGDLITIGQVELGLIAERRQ